MVLLLQHNNSDFVLFKKLLFLLGNSSIQVLILDRANWAFTQRYLGNSDCEDDCHKTDCGLCVELQRTHRGAGLHNEVQMKLKAESNSPETPLNAGLSLTTTHLGMASGPGRLL